MKEKIGRILSSKYIDFTFYLAYFAAAIYISVGRDFWYDEVAWTVRFVHKKSMLTMLKELSESLYNLPLHYVVINLFYRISHSQVWLRIPSILASLGAVYYTQKFIVKHYGAKYRLLAYILFISAPLMFHIALQVRPYAFMLFFAAMSYYYYYERLANDKWKNIIVFGFILTFLEYSHWYGGLLIACYGLTDFYLWVRKRVRFRCIVSYVMCFILFLPWMIAVVLNHYYDFQTYWGVAKSYGFILRILYCITGSQIVTFFVLSAAMYALYIMLFRRSVTGEKFVIEPLCHICLIVWGMWTVMWTYGRLVPQGSLIEVRYFFVCIPLLVILLTAFVRSGILQTTVARVVNHICEKKFFEPVFLSVVAVVVSCVISIHAKPIVPEFYGYQKLLQEMRNDVQSNKRVLFLWLCEFFWDYYDENIGNIDVATHYLFSTKQYSEKFSFKKLDVKDKKQVLDFLRINQENLEILKKSDCVTAMRHFSEYEKKKIYYTYKDNKKEEVISSYGDFCKYDVIYIDTRFWLRFNNLKTFIGTYYDIIPYDRATKVNHVDKLVRKTQKKSAKLKD